MIDCLWSMIEHNYKIICKIQTQESIENITKSHSGNKSFSIIYDMGTFVSFFIWIILK